MHSNIPTQSNLSQHPLETTPKQGGCQTLPGESLAQQEKQPQKPLKSCSKFSQRISDVSSARLSSVGKEQLLGKQLFAFSLGSSLQILLHLKKF